MVTNVDQITWAGDFAKDDPLDRVSSTPAAPRETATSALPYVAVLVLLALASAIQALSHPELFAGIVLGS